MAWKREEAAAVASVWDMTGVATGQEISCVDDDLPTVKSGNVDFARWVKGQPHQQIGNHRRECD